MTTAVFIDGAFFVKRLRYYLPETDHYDAKKMADVAMGMALEHLKLRNKNKESVFLYICYQTSLISVQNALRPLI